MDEKAVAKRHRYVTLVCDLDRATVEYIGDDRKRTSLDAYYQSLSKKQLAGIKAVAMDMWEPFVSSTVTHVPDGKSAEALETVVLLGDPFAFEACGESGADDPQPPGQRAHVLRPSDHQRHERGSEFEDSDNKKNSYGFRNRDHLKTAIFFHCGGLKLYPVQGRKKA